jgi:hypothetical protein
VQGITRVKAGDMCDQKVERAVKAANRKGGKGALNLYITDLSSCGLLGYSTWPWELDPKAGKKDALTMDGVVIHHETLPGGSYKPYNEGRTCIHETGHWMGCAARPRATLGLGWALGCALGCAPSRVVSGLGPAVGRRWAGRLRHLPVLWSQLDP